MLGSARIHEDVTWLISHDLDQEQECLIGRIIYREEVSLSYISGQPAPLSQWSEIDQLLVDVHGQHDHQRLMHRDHHGAMLDEYAHTCGVSRAGSPATQPVAEVQSLRSSTD